MHHHLVRTKSARRSALVVESGDAREVHHIALLIGFGAAAVNPYLAFESIEDLIREGELTGIEAATAVAQLPQGARQGRPEGDEQDGHLDGRLLHRRAGLRGDRALASDVVDEYFTGTPSRLGGVGLDVIAEEVALRHRRAYPENPTERAHRRLEVGGEYQCRREGELHLFNPETVFLLQHATRTGRYDVFQQYTDEVDRLAARAGTLRGLFELTHGVRAAGAARRGRAGRRRSSSGSTPAR